MSRHIAAPLLLCLASGCNLFISVPTPRAVEVREDAPVTLPTSSKLRYWVKNLGEVAPGLLYRSAYPSESLITHLHERAKLGHIVDLTTKADPWEVELIERYGGSLTHLRMSADRPPTAKQILELIRVTQDARREGETILLHCHGGADRTGMMTGLWRRLFQDVTDTSALKREAFLHRHFRAAHPIVHQVIDTFRPELFQPFVDDPSLVSVPERVAELESNYVANLPLLSGNRRRVAGNLRVGTAKADLLEGLSLPVQMATYGPAPGKGGSVREPVFARAVTLETRSDDGESNRVAIVSCDLMLIDAPLRRDVLARLEDTDPKEIGLKDTELKDVGLTDLFLSATHTHTSVGGYVDHTVSEFYILGAYDERLRAQVVDRIVAAIKASIAALEPAHWGVSRTFVDDISRNRRLGTTIDPEVGLLKFTRPNGDPIAVVVNFAAHPILEPNDNTFSSDYPGRLCRRLDETHGFGLFLGGALGDLNAKPPVDLPREASSAAVAERLFDVITPVLENLETQAGATLGSATQQVALPPTNVGLVPDFLMPLDVLVGAACDWPRYATVQSVRLGEVSLLGVSSEIGVRVGLQLKRQSPAAYPFIVTHTNDYTGYAVTATNHAKRKIDPTSVVLLNGPRHAGVLQKTAGQLWTAQWNDETPKGATPNKESADGVTTESDDRLSPAGLERFELDSPELLESETQSAYATALAAERRAAGLDEDSTAIQSRRFRSLLGDSLNDTMRLQVGGMYFDRLRGGQRQEGRRREVNVELQTLLPLELRLHLSGGYTRAEWRQPTGGPRDSDEGVRDFTLGVSRAFELASSAPAGNALRATTRVETTIPTGNLDADAPFAFSKTAGVFRPALGAGLEFTWNTYKTFSLEALYRTAIDRRKGRRPGERIETRAGYSERHGIASYHLDFAGSFQHRDQRRGGRTAVDVRELSWTIDFEPGLSLHLGESWELYGQAAFSIARSGSGAGPVRAVAFGLQYRM